MEFWIDVAAADAEIALKHMKKYAIRKKVAIQDVSHILRVYSA